MNTEFQSRTARSADPALLAPLEPRFEPFASPLFMTQGRSASAQFAGSGEPPSMEDFNKACAGFEDERYQDILRLVFNKFTRAQFREFVAALEKVEESEDPEESRLLNFFQRERELRLGDLPFPHQGGPHRGHRHRLFARGEDKIEDNGDAPEASAPGMNWSDTLMRGFAQVQKQLRAKLGKSFSRRFDEYAAFEHEDRWEDRWMHSREDAIWSISPEVDALAPESEEDEEKHTHPSSSDCDDEPCAKSEQYSAYGLH